MSIFGQLLTEKVFLLTDGAARQMKFDKNLTQDGLSVYVDAVALNYLKGTEIDFVTPPTGASLAASAKSSFSGIGTMSYLTTRR